MKKSSSHLPMSMPDWPPHPLAPPYRVEQLTSLPTDDLETLEVRLVFRDWLDRDVSISAPVCYLNGTNDFFGDPLIGEQLLASLTVPHVRHYLPNVDHSLDPAQTRLAEAWLRHYLLDGPPVLDALDSAATALWWTDDLEGPSVHRCWLPGPPPADRSVIAFSHQTSGDITCSTPLENLSASAPHERSRLAGIPFGLGWHWELGSTRLFSNDVSADPPASEGEPWRVSPARMDNADESVGVILHPSRTALASVAPHADLILGWSARPHNDQADVQLHLRAPAAVTLQGRATWADETLRIRPVDFPLLPTEFSWSAVGRVQIVAPQSRKPFCVGPLISS